MTQRKRATVILLQEQRILLVRERGQSRFGLPGGGIERNEPSLLAAVREVWEETRLHLSSIRFLGELEGSWATHYVFLAEGYGRVHLQRKELSDYHWWCRGEEAAVQGHVRGALRLAGDFFPGRDYLSGG